MRFRTLALALVLETACVSKLSTHLLTPDGPPNPKALILADDRAFDLEAYDLTKAGGLPDHFALATGVVAMWYADSLADLQIDPGRVMKLPPDATASRPVPQPFVAFEATYRGGQVVWQNVEALPKAIEDVRIGAIDLLACAKTGRCVRDGALTATVCTRCPTPVAPAPPDLSVAAPMPPVAPIFANPCPLGWKATAIDGVPVCDPEALTSTAGSHCPQGQFAADLPPNRPILYVSPGATGGDGSQGAPLGTIAAAIAQAADGSIIALAKGTLHEDVVLGRALTLWGACPAGTIIASLNGVAVTGGPQGGALHGLALRGGAGALLVSGSSTAIALSDVAIRDTPTAIEASGGGRVDLSRVLIERSSGLAIRVHDPRTVLRMNDVVIRDTLPGGDGTGGQAIQATNGSSVAASRLVIVRSRRFGIESHDEPTTVFVSDLVVSRTLAEESSGKEGGGIEVERAHAILVRADISDSMSYALRAEGRNASLTVSDLNSARTAPQPVDGAAGVGILVENGARAHVQRATFRDHHSADILIGGEMGLGTDATLTDVTILRSTTTATSAGYDRVAIRAGANVHIEGMLVDHPASVAIGVAARGNVTLQDVHVIGTSITKRIGSGPVDGFSIRAVDGGSATVTRGLFEDDENSAMLIAQASTIDLSDVVIQGSGYAGVHAAELSVFSARRTLVRKARGAAVWVGGLALAATLEDFRIEGTRPLVTATDCAGTFSCIGTGIVIDEKTAAVTLSRFDISGSEYAGMVIGYGSRPTMKDGAMSKNQESDVIVRESDFPLQSLIQDVVYGDDPAITVMP